MRAQANRVPRAPTVEMVLSRANMHKALEGEAPPWVLDATYDYWRAKRKREGGPLLEHLWFEQPWKVRRVLQRMARHWWSVVVTGAVTRAILECGGEAMWPRECTAVLRPVVERP